MQKETLIRIARLLILHVSIVNNPGILKGKMGFILFFFHLNRKFDHPLYGKFAEELLDEVYEDIQNTNNRQIVYRECAEIAWGLLYLIRHRFVEGEEKDIIAMFDTLVLNSLAYPDPNIHAIIHYLISRKTANTPIGIPSRFIESLFTAMKYKPGEKHYELQLLDKLQKQEPVDNYTDSFLQRALDAVHYTSDEIFSDRPIGIEANGLTGIGLKMILNGKTV